LPTLIFWESNSISTQFSTVYLKKSVPAGIRKKDRK
jgi:hypothetical protein